MGQVIMGLDPHKRSATIEVIDGRERVLGKGRFGTDRDGYQVMLAAGGKHTDRIWAVEGCNGIGRHVAMTLVHPTRGHAEQVADAMIDVRAATARLPRSRSQPGKYERCRSLGMATLRVPARGRSRGVGSRCGY